MKINESSKEELKLQDTKQLHCEVWVFFATEKACASLEK